MENHPPRRLTVGGVEWQYLAGGAAKSAVVFFPGGIRVADFFFPLLTALEENHRVVAPSYPPVATMDELVLGVAAILDAEGIPRAHVIGESFGGQVAQVFVRRYPERVDRLILANTAPPHSGLARPLRWMVQVLLRTPTPLLRMLSERVLFRVLSAPLAEQGFWRQLIEEILFRRFTREDFMSFFTDTLDFHAHYPSGPDGPTRGPGEILIIESGDDRGVPAVSREALKRLYPQGAVHRFDHGGHTPWLTEPEAYFSAVRAFLADHTHDDRRLVVHAG